MNKIHVHTEKLSSSRQRRWIAAFDTGALTLLPGPQHALLLKWLKSSAERRNWDGLLKLADTQVELAESLSQSLFDCGAAAREEELKYAIWQPLALIWRDYESLCRAIGVTTRNTLSATITASWHAAQHVVWQRASLANAYQALNGAHTEKDAGRLVLLRKINEWLLAGKSGTRRDFSLFARGQTKQLSVSEWAWLQEVADLSDCGIERHEPALWLAGDVQLQIGERWLDLGAAGDFVALTPQTIARIKAGKTSATHYRLVENRTSFERVARAKDAAGEIVVWLPGYAPTWWRTALAQLLTALPLPARISCDADPDGVQIAINAAQVWGAQKLAWQPHAMAAANIAGAAHKLPMTEHDMQLAASLLAKPDLAPGLADLLRWCLQNNVKAEQENWL
jgi:DNA topoisomerase VI subunit A